MEGAKNKCLSEILSLGRMSSVCLVFLFIYGTFYNTIIPAENKVLMLGRLVYYETKWHRCNLRYIPKRAWWDWRRPRKKDVRTVGNRDETLTWKLQNRKHNFSFLSTSDRFYLAIVGAEGYCHTWSHSMPHIRYDSSGQVIGPSQRPRSEQNTRLIIKKYICPRWNSNPQFKQVNDRMHMP